MDKFITVGVAGHVDHGKTSLVRCLTGIDTDRLKEEKRRGLSIEPSVAPLELPSGRGIALVDVPGHSDFLRNTIRGLSSVDTAILVVAADDGVMPQTIDHLEVLRFLGAHGGIIVLGKADLVDDETLELAEMEIHEIVEGSFLEGKPVIRFSAMDGRGLDEILAAVECEVQAADGKRLQAPFRLWVDQVRSFPGFGTVVSGTVISGRISRDDTVQLLPSGKETKVRFIETHHQRVEEAVAGQRVGLNLHRISLQEIELGMVLASPEVLSPTKLLNAELSLLPTARRPLLDRQRVKLYLGTHCTSALALMMEKKRLDQGETGLVQFRFREPVAVLPRDSYVISPMNLHTVIGGGKILETSKEKFRTVKAENTLAYLEPLQKDDVKSVARLYFLKFPNRPVSAEEISSGTGLSMDGIHAEIESRLKAGKLLHLNGHGYFVRARYELLKKKLVEVTREILSHDAFKTAASASEIRFRLEPSLDDAPFERMLGELCKEDKLVWTDAGYRIPNFVAKLSSGRSKLIEQLVAYANRQGYATFSAGTFCKLHRNAIQEREVQKVLDHLHAQKKLVRLNDGRYLTAESMQEIKDKVKALILRKGSLTIQDCWEIFGYGRNRAIPVLDYLDATGFTHRKGDARVLAPEGGLMRNLRA
jgi:selenocysteine-specific elongation factor